MKCGQTILIELNISKFNLPNFYFLCTENLKLIQYAQINGITVPIDYIFANDSFNANHFISENSSQMFSCLNHLVRSDQPQYYVISGAGILPNISKQVDLASVYIYPADPRAPDFSSDTYSNVSYFLSHKDANKIFELDANIKC